MCLLLILRDCDLYTLLEEADERCNSGELLFASFPSPLSIDAGLNSDRRSYSSTTAATLTPLTAHHQGRSNRCEDLRLL
jgi:hypothetical protein